MSVFSAPPESPPILSPTKYREQVFIWEVCGSCHSLVPDYKTKPFHYWVEAREDIKRKDWFNE